MSGERASAPATGSDSVRTISLTSASTAPAGAWPSTWSVSTSKSRSVRSVGFVSRDSDSFALTSSPVTVAKRPLEPAKVMIRNDWPAVGR